MKNQRPQQRKIAMKDLKARKDVKGGTHGSNLNPTNSGSNLTNSGSNLTNSGSNLTNSGSNLS